MHMENEDQISSIWEASNYSSWKHHVFIKTLPFCMSSACMLNEKVYRVMFRRQINFSLCKDKQLFLPCYINTCSTNLVEECILPLFFSIYISEERPECILPLRNSGLFVLQMSTNKMTLKTCSDKILIEGWTWKCGVEITRVFNQKYYIFGLANQINLYIT